MNGCRPVGEIGREHAESGADLEHDVTRTELGEAPDHAQDVLVRQEVLTEVPLRADDHPAVRGRTCRLAAARAPAPLAPTGGFPAGSENAAVAFASIRAASASTSSPRLAARAATTWTTFAGSLGRPRRGCGARYGASVSVRMRSAGTRAAASRSSGAFGYVTLPANETYQPRSSAGSRSGGDEKQCSTTDP